MRIKTLVVMMGHLLFLGFSGGAMAYNDVIGDTEAGHPTVDIEWVSVELFDIKDVGDGDTSAQKIKLGVKMALGSHLPGAILWDFDADHDTTTGSGSVITGIPLPPCGPPNPCKTAGPEGFDILLLLTLRAQGDTSNNSVCNNCVGGSTHCMTKGPSCGTCDQGACFTIDGQTTCSPGNADCWEVSNACTGCSSGTNCYPMTVPCGAGEEACSDGMRMGEWYAAPSVTRGNDRVVRGNVYFPLWTAPENLDEICITLPWHMITGIIWQESGFDFDIHFASGNAPHYQVTAFYDENFYPPGDKEDFFTGGTMDLTDYVPNTEYAATDGVYRMTEECKCDFDSDNDCDGSDAYNFKTNFGRSADCPGCRAM